MDNFEARLKAFNNPNESSSPGMFSSFFNRESSASESTTSLLGSFRSSPQEEDCIKLSRWQRMIATLILLSVSAICFMISMMNIFFLAINPAKFAVSYTFGSILALAASAVLKGFKPWIKHTFSYERLPFTAIYFGSMGLTLYFALGSRSYIPTLLCSIVQFVALFWYFGSYLPGGVTALSWASRGLGSGIGLPI